MKPLLPALGWLLLSSAVHAADPAERKGGTGLGMIPENTGHPTSEATTDEKFIARRDAALSHQQQPKPLPPARQSFGLLEMSTVIETAGNYILLPKGAVLWTPPVHQEKIVAKPSGRFIEWMAFLTANRSWITTFEVTPDQISGKLPISTDLTERFRKMNLVVVATFQGNPVSVISHAP